MFNVNSSTISIKLIGQFDLGVLFIVTQRREWFTSFEVYHLGIPSLVILTNVNSSTISIKPIVQFDLGVLFIVIQQREWFT